MIGEFSFCPRCGAPLAEGHVGGRQRRLCHYCGYVHYRDPKVAVGALVTLGDRVALIRRGMVPRRGYWALPAGYMDHDELPEEALVREIEEETGLSVRSGGLLAIVPLSGWEERRGILLLFRAQPVAGELRSGDDADEARWFSAGDVPWDDIAFESTAEALRAWIEELGSSGGS